ncbi:MAG: FGGY-family carbohydrate kinase [Smithellaceae bacterium]|nr:FGGY-family carbohydrate kinase [Smithellaceae bacterium]
MSKDLILTIDNGTQSVRALVFDLQGNLVAKSQIQLEPYFSEKPGWAEQHAEYYWDSLCQACQKLWETSGVAKDAIAGVTITTQRSTVINLDKDGKPLRPAIVWLDQRRTENLPPLGGLWGTIFKLPGLRDTVNYLRAEAEANWIRTYQPEIWRKTYKYVFLSGYHIYKLTGRFVDSIGSQVGYIPFDYRKQCWSAGLEAWKWDVLPVEPSMVPELVPPAGQLGAITKEASEATGIPAGLPVIAAAADKACEVIGSGALEPNIGCLSYGTTATFNTTHKKYVEAIPLIPPYPAAVPGYYSLEMMVYRGFWMVSWFKKEFALREERLAEELGVTPETLFDDLLNQVPPGSMGLVLQPFWSPGLKVPGPEAKGAIIGFSDVHTRAHIYRAMLEGLAYALRNGKERSEKRSGIPVTELRVAGGGSQSDAAMQLTADIFGLPAGRPHIYEASGLGAAIDAAVGLKFYPDFSAAVKAMTRVGRQFLPNPQTRRIYDDLYNKIYQQMYGRLKPLYEELRKIIS